MKSHELKMHEFNGNQRGVRDHTRWRGFCAAHLLLLWPAADFYSQFVSLEADGGCSFQFCRFIINIICRWLGLALVARIESEAE